MRVVAAAAAASCRKKEQFERGEKGRPGQTRQFGKSTPKRKQTILGEVEPPKKSKPKYLNVLKNRGTSCQRRSRDVPKKRVRAHPKKCSTESTDERAQLIDES